MVSCTSYLLPLDAGNHMLPNSNERVAFWSLSLGIHNQIYELCLSGSVLYIGSSDQGVGAESSPPIKAVSCSPFTSDFYSSDDVLSLDVTDLSLKSQNLRRSDIGMLRE